MTKDETKTADSTTLKLPDTQEPTSTSSSQTSSPEDVIAPPFTMVVKGEKGFRNPNIVKIDQNSHQD